MTVYKRGLVYLNCLICGHGDFEILRNYQPRGKILKCKKCGFKMRDSGYFDQMPASTDIPQMGSSICALKPKDIEAYADAV